MEYSRIIFVLVLVFKCAMTLERCEHGNCTIGISNNGTTLNQTSRVMMTDKIDPSGIPTSLNMLAIDDEHQETTQATTAPSIFVTAPPTMESPKGRAINFTSEEQHAENGLTANSTDSTRKDDKDLSDVSMDDDDEGSNSHKGTENTNFTPGICVKGGLTYSNGEKIEDGCETVCTCMSGKMDCTERCAAPYVRKGKAVSDPLCREKPAEDTCCSVLVCATDTETEPLEMCVHQNKTYQRGEKFNDGCSQICICEAAGKFTCKPRCRAIHKTSDRCVEVPDPADSCCKMVLCDVSLDDHEHNDKDQDVPKLKLISAKFVNASRILLKLDSKIDDKSSLPQVELSSDRQVWKNYKVMSGGYIEGAKVDMKYARLENTDDYIVIQNTDLVMKSQDKKDINAKNCVHNGETHKIGAEFYDGCTSFCTCLDTGVKCLKIQCPTYFGLDVVDPNCLDWEPEPSDFIATPPNCCPEKVRCKNNGSCIYEGVMYQNWQELPVNTTGCDKRCYCEMGKVECQSACPPVTAVPPATLPCPNHRASLSHLPDDDCCLAWICSTPDEPPPSTDDNTPKKTDKQRPDGFNNHTIIKKPIYPVTSNNKTHKDSGFAGPLLIYENEKPPTPPKTVVNESSDLQNLHMEHESPFNPNIPNGIPTNGDKQEHFDNSPEGPPYQHIGGYNGPWSNTPNSPNKDEILVKPLNENSNKSPSYIGPFNPDFKTPIAPPSKSKKGNKTSAVNSAGNKQKGDRFRPPFVIPQSNNNPFQQPQFGSIQRPDEILQIINQHPELANYPPGSVFEIHNYDPNVKYQQNHQQNPIGRPPRPPVGPYLNQVDSGNSNYPQNIPIDQLIKHVQNGQLPPGLTRPGSPFGQNSQFAQNPSIYSPHGLQFPLINGQPQLNANQTSDFPGFPNVPGYQTSPDDISVQQVEAIDGQTVRLIFSVSSLIVGLHGRVEVRYTNKPDDNLAHWEVQVFAPPNDLIATQQLEFDLIGLQPNTEYRLKITIMLRDLHNTPSSRIYTVRTPAQVSTLSTLPPMIPIEPNLAVLDLNSTWANIAWRKLTDFELQFVDGVQLRFKEISGKVYAATPLIHRAVTSYTLENLKANTEYEAGIFYIPFTGQTTELQAEKKINFTTSPELDPYAFNVTLEILQIKPTTVEISWSGVPYPEDKYVNIYRAIYQSDTGKGDSSTFKIAKRDSPTKTTVQDLKPGTRYRLWLEVYLTSGKIKTSNVQDFITKPRSAPAISASTQQGKLLSNGDIVDHSSDYYGPLVVVAILAAIAILSTLILLMILVKRHTQNKAAISSNTRISQSAYDNPTYKVEIQQETMDL